MKGWWIHWSRNTCRGNIGGRDAEWGYTIFRVFLICITILKIQTKWNAAFLSRLKIHQNGTATDWEKAMSLMQALMVAVVASTS